MLGLMVVLIAHATASNVRCISWNHSVPENVIVLNISPMVRCTHSIITGTADLNWIKKNTLIQHKARLTIPDINSELQKCYQVSDPDLHELLLSPRARFKKNGEYLCCTQCERALQMTD